MKTLFYVFAICASTMMSSFGAQASTCTLQCQINYTDVLDWISQQVSTEQRTDFATNCREFHRGSYGSNSARPGEYLCMKNVVDQREVSGYGFDIAQARQSARDACDRAKPTESSYTLNPRVTYLNYSCQP